MLGKADDNQACQIQKILVMGWGLVRVRVRG